MTSTQILIEVIGWISTITFLVSIVWPQRVGLHQWGIFTSVTTGIYSYAHGATAIWVKWTIAFFFHTYMLWRLKREEELPDRAMSMLNAPRVGRCLRIKQVDIFSRFKIGRMKRDLSSDYLFY